MCVLAAGLLPGASAAAKSKPAQRAGKEAPPAKAAFVADDGGDLGLVALEEMQLGRASVKAGPARKEAAPAAPSDSLDGLLNHSTYVEPPAPAPAPAKERMKFPGEKDKADVPPTAKAEVVAPDRITSDVTAKAIAAAKPVAKPGKTMAAAAVLPKLPTKQKVDDDPLAGMAAKDMVDKGGKTNKRPVK